MGQVGAEHRYGVAVGAQRGQPDRPASGPHLGEEVFDVDRPPRPRIVAGEDLEPPDDPGAGLDRVDRQAAGEHLAAPAIEHRLEHPVMGPEQADIRIPQNPRHEARNTIHQPLPSVETCIKCRKSMLTCTRAGWSDTPTGRRT
jgi:hypothetical protein